jgi:hypothetical protein
MQNIPFATQQAQINKFLQANRVLGAQMDQMQGTTQVIYDTQDFTGLLSYDFFSEVAGKQTTNVAGSLATNISENRFQPGEGMVIKEIAFRNLETTAANVLNINEYFSLSLLNVTVGNNKVIKDFPLFAMTETMAINNFPSFTGSTTEVINRRLMAVRFLTNIVIPPQVQFSVNLKCPIAPSADPNSDAVLRCYIKGYGKLFNPRNNY